MQATVTTLIERIEAAEAKAKASVIELRTAVNEAMLRLHTVETVTQAALAVEAPTPTVDEMLPAAREPEASPDAALPEAPKSYLSEVRKSVAASAAVAVEAPKPVRRRSLARYFLAAIATLMVFAAGAGVAFSKGVSDGRSEALSHRPVHTVAAFAQTPLDRLTARAEAGDAAAELAVGLRYLGKSPVQAFRWIALSAARGQPVAQYRLGLLYEAGVGTPADAARALPWFEAAALQGNRKAMHQLAVAYAQGQGAAKNTAEAVRWFSKAAGYGYVDSEFDLAVLYERGDGVPQSLLDAYKWYAVASRAGDAESKARLEALKTQLGPEDVAAADHAAAAFHAAPFNPSANAL